MVRLCVTVLMGCCAVTCWSQQQPDERSAPYRDKQTGLLFPAKLGDFIRHDVKVFSAARLGVGIRYRAGDTATVDVMIYNGGHATIPSDPRSETVAQEAEKALGDIRAAAAKGYFPDLTVDKRGIVPLGSSDNAPTAHRFDLSFGPKNARYSTLLIVAGHKNHFVKVRATYGSGEANRKQVQLLVNFINRELSRPSARSPKPPAPRP